MLSSDTPDGQGKPVTTSDTLVVLTNPRAGKGRGARATGEVLELLRTSGLTIQPVTPNGAEEAEQACAEAVASGARGVVVLGGDGTIHVALQALAGSGVPLGIVPVGTGNDLVGSLGLPTEPQAAAAAIVTAVRAGHTRVIDLARVTTEAGVSRWYATTLAAGFDSAVADRVNRMRWPRGPLRYHVAVLVELARLRVREFQITVDGTTHTVPGIFAAVGNTGWYGSGAPVCPQADPADGLLDVTVAGPVGRLTLIRLKPLLYRGEHLGHPLVRTFRGATIRLEADGVIGYADGERIAPLPLELTAVPGALRLLASPQAG